MISLYWCHHLHLFLVRWITCLVTLSVEDELRHTGSKREACHRTERREVALNVSVQKHLWRWTLSCSAQWCAHGPWPTAEITAPSLKVCPSPDLLFPISLSWETKPCAWAIFQRTHILSLLKKKKITQAMKRCCLLKTPLKALSASLLSVSCQNGCNLHFTTVKFISRPWCCPDWLYHTHMLVKW